MTNKKGARTNQEEKSKQWEKRQKESLGMFDTEFANEFNVKHEEAKSETRRNKEREKKQGKC
ncbi:MAG: hypothetical protein ACQER2_05000 [Bacillota bacterium]